MEITFDDYCKAIGCTIRVLREKKKISQGELARRIKLTPACISYIESGQRTASLETLTKISGAIGCTPAKILLEAEKSLP